MQDVILSNSEPSNLRVSLENYTGFLKFKFKYCALPVTLQRPTVSNDLQPVRERELRDMESLYWKQRLHNALAKAQKGPGPIKLMLQQDFRFRITVKNSIHERIL